ncbi:MAG: hypothetical protein ABIE14_04520 [Patescibacteria group bacterium]
MFISLFLALRSREAKDGSKRDGEAGVFKQKEGSRDGDLGAHHKKDQPNN